MNTKMVECEVGDHYVHVDEVADFGDDRIDYRGMLVAGPVTCDDCMQESYKRYLGG